MRGDGWRMEETVRARDPSLSSSSSLSPFRQGHPARDGQPVAVDLEVGGPVGGREGELEGGRRGKEAQARVGRHGGSLA